MKILVVSPEYFPEEILSKLKDVGTVDSKKLSREELLNQIENYDAVLTRVDVKFDKEVLERAKNLKVIGSGTTAVDHVDVEYAKSRGIEIISLSGAHTVSTAEHTFALILALARKIPWAFESLKKGEWDRGRFFGIELEGKTLGTIGFGKIGSKVAKYAKSLGMKVLTYDPYINKDLANEIGVEMTTLDDLLQNSDVITIHAFLSDETRNMINSGTISKMKPTVLLINAARGEIIDTDALIDALNNKKIAGAALDVFEKEPLPPDSKLIEYAKNNDNLIITPHIAASTNEAVHRAAEEVVTKVREYLTH
jgi:D-3-phosphoglycerate dehydrogenase